MRACLVVLAVVGAAAAGQARAHDVSLELGQCRFGLEADGTFYQSDRYTRNYMTPRCAALGLADRFKAGPFGWRLALVWTGYVEARGNVATFFDADAFQQNLVCQDNFGPNRARGCLVTHNASGHTWGVSVTGTYEHRFGWAVLTAETGLFFFRHSFTGHAEHIDCSTCRPIRDYNESSGPFAQPSPLVGLMARAGPVYVAWRYYWPSEHRALSLTDHSFLQLTGGVVRRF